MSKYDDLVKKLKEIFQIDRPELDFGVYRILNARVAEINDYKTRHRYISMVDAEPGMVLGAQLNVIRNGYFITSFSAGHQLTEDNLSQLRLNHAEFLFVTEPDTRSAEQIAVDTAAAAHRVMEIFDGADLTNPTIATLFNQVIIYRSA